MDVVFDTVGGDTFARAFRTLRKGGFLVTAVAFPTDEAESYGVGVGCVCCRPDAGQLASLSAMAEQHKLAPRVAEALPLSRVRDALTLSEHGLAPGKIVVRIGAQRKAGPIVARPLSSAGHSPPATARRRPRRA